MTKEMEKLVAVRDELLKKVDDLIATNKMDTQEATDLLAEAAKNEAAITNLRKAEELKKGSAVEDGLFENTKSGKKGNGFVVIANALKNGVFTDAIGTPLKTGGLNGENYLLPEDVKLEINIAKKEWLSAKEIVRVESTFALKGSVNYGKDPTEGLIAFDDGDEIDSSKLPEFSQKTFAIKWYGAIIPVSNILTGAEQAGLMTFIRIWFVRRSIITENKAIFAAYKAGYNSGTPKMLADEKALRKSINTDLDPAFTKSTGMKLVTNQSGFNYLDSLYDESGHPLLQADPTKPTSKMYKGYPIYVYSDSQFPNLTSGSGSTAKTLAPLIYGDTEEGATMKVYEDYFFDTDNGKGLGFAKNQTLLKVIEGFDVISTDTSSYIYGAFDITPKASGS